MRARLVSRVGFRVAITCYAAGLLIWLALGLLPPVAEHVGVVRDALTSMAAHESSYGRFAARVLHPDTMADMTSGTQTAVQYLFSALNLGLGLLLALRRPDQTVPRLLAFALLGTAATFNLPSHRAFHITGDPWPVALIHFTFHIVSGVTYAWAVLLFPDGRWPRQIRLRRAATATAATLFTAVVAVVCWRSSFLSHPQFFVIFFGIAVPVLGVGAQVLRLRDPRTSPAERRTARMLCAALLPAFAAAVIWLGARLGQSVTSGGANSAAAGAADRVATWFPLVFAVVPVVLFGAVLRYRLWDIDRWLTRVLVYAVLALLIGIGYVLAVVIGGRLAGPGSVWTLVVALAIVATLADPVRRAARRWANRVVFGVSLSPEDALRALSDGLAQQTPMGELDQVAAVAVRSTRAAAVHLWLVDGAQLVCGAAAPSESGPAAVGTVADLGAADAPSYDAAASSPAAAASVLDPAVCFPVRHQGELLGVLAATATDGGAQLPRRDRAVLAAIADHAGLLVRNAVLTVGLARRAEQLEEVSAQLRRARRRLVEAQDAERRRLERNVHDGAQQALVAALIAIRSLDRAGVVPADPADARDALTVARDSLIELTESDRPAVLDRRGLAGAIAHAAQMCRRTGVDATVTADIDEREIDPDVASAVYFCCSEALQNVGKYAAATAVSVDLRIEEGELIFTVTDNGSGFDPAGVITAAGGLSRLDERLAVLGGTLSVRTKIGTGTRVVGRAPVRPLVAR